MEKENGYGKYHKASSVLGEIVMGKRELGGLSVEEAAEKMSLIAKGELPQDEVDSLEALVDKEVFESDSQLVRSDHIHIED